MQQSIDDWVSAVGLLNANILRDMLGRRLPRNSSSNIPAYWAQAHQELLSTVLSTPSEVLVHIHEKGTHKHVVLPWDGAKPIPSPTQESECASRRM